jgi:uncharacterized membrane protein
LDLGASPADWLALTVFGLCVVGYSRFADLSPHRNMLNARMRRVRRRWVRQMLDRDDRVTDTILTGHSANAISFFASATILVLAGLIGIVSRTEDLYLVVGTMIMVRPTSMDLFQFKLLGLIGIFIYGFYCFTWSLLQASYYFGLMGAAPPANTAGPAELDRIAVQIATVLNNVFANFNAGIRTYYYGLAWLGWFFQPVTFVIATIFITAVLIARQFASTSAKAICDFADMVDKDRPG